MKDNTAGTLLLAAVLSCAFNANAQNLLVNGGFESPVLPSPDSQAQLVNGSTLVPGWVSVDNVPSGTLFVDNFLQRAPYFGLFPASEGQQFIYIDNNNGPSPSMNGIYQDFATTIGLEYRVTFDATTELSYGIPGLLGVSAAGINLHYTLPNVVGYPVQPYQFTGWSTYEFAFQANSATTRLQFYDEGFQVGGDPTNGNASPLLDNVSVTLVPEPVAVASVAGVACVLCAFARRRRARS